MAGLHNQIKYFSFLSGLHQVLGLDGFEEGISRLSESLVAVMDPWTRAEVLAKIGIRLWSARFVVGAGGAGNRSEAQVFNPATSSIITVVTDIDINCQVAPQAVQVCDSSTALVTFIQNVSTRDERVFGTVTQMRSSNAAAATAGIAVLAQGGGTAVNFHDHLREINGVYQPGFGCIVRPDTDNQAVAVTLRGYEREALPGELRL